jgi:probable HAF family extracellular repeat protein
MKSTVLMCIASLFLFVSAISMRLTAQVEYTVIDLGSLGGSFSSPNTMNNRGQITGGSSLKGDELFHAFFWDNGTMTDLGTLGGPISVGAGINESGEVVVGADTNMFGGLPNTICATAAICRMFIWRKGVRVVPDLGTLEGGTDTGIYDIVSFGNGTNMIKQPTPSYRSSGHSRCRSQPPSHRRLPRILVGKGSNHRPRSVGGWSRHLR